MSVPKLRFKEFKGEWEVKKLKDLTEILRCGIASTPIYVEEGVPFLSAQNVNANGQIVLDKYNFISEEFYEKISKNHELSNGDLLYSRVGASFGNSAVFQLDGKYGVYVSLTHIRPNKKLSNFFLNFFLNSNNGKKQAKNGVFQGGGVPNLNVKIVEKFEIPFPTVKEQTKIAEFLMAVDEKIAQLTQKCALLARYKKGVMQQLFSQDIRFKDDSDRAFPDWEYILIGEIINFENGKAHESNITDNGNYIVVNSKFISSNGTVIKRSNTAISPLRSNTIVMVMSDVPNGKALAKCYFIESDDKYTLNQRICSMTSQIAAPKFLFYQINRNSYYLKFDNGVGQTNLRKDDVLSCPIMYPPSVQEQIKIANFLISIDEKISQAQTYLETVKQYKQGLLQQMFV